MKKLRLCVLLCLCIVPRFHAQTSPPATAWVSVAWNASPSTNVTGYYVYIGLVTRSYTNRTYVPASILTATLSNLVNGLTYYLNVTAVDQKAGLESDYDGEVMWKAPNANLPPSPTSLRYVSSP